MSTGAEVVYGSRPSVLILPGVDTIDATGTDTSFLGHSYFADARSVLSDMYYLISTGQRADKRFGLQRASGDGGSYWAFKQ